MPGIRAHYFFGRSNIDNFPDDIQSVIQKYPKSFNLGLQGPDIFFYSVPAHTTHDHNIGVLLHKSRVMDFFDSLITIRSQIKNTDRAEICDAYIAGFIGHYSLDTVCHPYIHYRANDTKISDEKRSFGCHVLLETDIDSVLTRHFMHSQVSSLDIASTISISRFEIENISELLYRAIKNVYPEDFVTRLEVRHAAFSSRTLFRLIRDPNNWKKKLMRSIDGKLFGYPFMSPIIALDDYLSFPDPLNLRHRYWRNPWDENITSNKDFYQLMDEAGENYITRILNYDKYTHSQNPDSCYAELISSLSDLSYDSGLPLTE